MLRLAFDFIIAWREIRARPNAYLLSIIYKVQVLFQTIKIQHLKAFVKRYIPLNSSFIHL